MLEKSENPSPNQSPNDDSRSSCDLVALISSQASGIRL